METKWIEILKLIEQATNAAKFRGHRIVWHYGDGDLNAITRLGTCIHCGKEVQVNCRPQPNEIDIGGEAVALGCS